MGEDLDTIRSRVAKNGSCAVRVPELLKALDLADQLTPTSGTQAMSLLARENLVPDVDLAGAVRSSHVVLRPAGAATVASAPTPSSTSSQRRGNLGAAYTVAVAALAGLVLGSITPWATTVLANKNGLQGDGVLTLILAVVIGIALWSYHSRPARGAALTGLISSLIATAIAIYDVVDISNSHARIFGEDVHVVSVGWGLWLALASSIVLVGACFALRGVHDGRSVAVASGNRDLDRVQKLAELRDSGALSDEEFEAQKRQVLPDASVGDEDG